MMSNAIRSFKEAFEIQGELGRLVDAATSEMQLGVDWQANMQICDKVRVSMHRLFPCFSIAVSWGRCVVLSCRHEHLWQGRR